MTALAIDQITIGERHRTDMGDIDSLAASISEVGLLHPIVITPDNRLIAGQRRIEAFRKLGRERIPVTVIDLEEVIRGEWAENAERKAFTPSEAVAIGKLIEEGERARAKIRARSGLRQGASAPARETFPDGETGKVVDIVGKAVGMSGRTYQKAKAVVIAAEENPEAYGPIKEEMDRTGAVDGAYKQIKTAKASPFGSRISIATRREHIIRLGKERHSVDAIATKVGVHPETVSKVLKEEGIELVSDRIGKLHKVKTTETMDGIVNQAVPAESAVALVLADWESLDRTQFQRWKEELRSAIRTLSRLERRLTDGSTGS